MRLEEVAPEDIKRVARYLWDRIIEKHEGPWEWDYLLDANLVEFINVNGFEVLLPVDKEHHPNNCRSATEDAINYLINQKKVPVGGTSAGMAILGDYYYAPGLEGVLSSEILNDPFHHNTHDIYRSDFLQVPFLKNVITDTHLDRCNDNHPETRYGRLFGFMARIMVSENQPVYGIGLEEGAFVAIDSKGIATVFGNDSERGQDAYFLHTNGAAPEQIEPELPLIWDNNGQAVKVYRIQGTPSGSGLFDLNNWLTADGGTWEYWFTTGGYSGFRQERISY